jgi:hypothetical protein
MMPFLRFIRKMEQQHVLVSREPNTGRIELDINLTAKLNEATNEIIDRES